MTKKTKLYYHPQLEVVLHAFVRRLPHAVLLTGARGVGLFTLARRITELANIATVTVVKPDEKGTIAIEAIRELYQQARSKRQKYAIIIDDAEAMTQPAQNALLKLLEEPNESLHFILTSHKPDRLLQTIRSRVQHTTVPLLPRDDVQALLKELSVSDAATQQQMMFMANGRPAEIHRIVADEAYFVQQKDIIRDAKQYLQGSSYDKILIIQKYSADREKAVRLLDAALIILSFSLKQKPQQGIIDQLDLIASMQEKIYENRHVKTQLLRGIF